MFLKTKKNELVCILLALFTMGNIHGQEYRIPYKTKSSARQKAMHHFHETMFDTTYAFDVLHYHLDLIFPLENSAFSGRATITCQSQTDYLNAISFNMVDLTADSVYFRGDKIAFDPQEYIIYIPVNQSINQSDTFSVAIYYQGEPEKIGFYFYERSAHTFAEPVYARYWFPCFDEPWDKATAELIVTVPRGVEVASIGLLESRELSTNQQWETFHWKTEYPVATYLICVTMSKYYARWSDWYINAFDDSIEIAYYVFEWDSSNAVNDFTNMVDAMTFFSDRFGEYPFEKYGMAEVDSSWFGGMEHQTMSTINSRWIQGDRSYEDGMVHELAHMWWGDAVTLNDWPAIWLNEGFATYSEALYAEYKKGSDALKPYMQYSKNMYLGQAEYNDFPIYNPSWEELFNWGIIYNKGAWVLHMLRHVIGDVNFWKVLNQYYETYKYGNASISDFRNVCESVSGMDLYWFFNEWIYQTGCPKIQFSWTSQSLSRNQYDIIMVFKQTQTDGPIFKMPIDLKLSLAEGTKDTSIWIENKQDIITLQVNSQPVDVQIDPDMWVLLELECVTYENLRSDETPNRFRLYANFPNPFNAMTWIDYNIPISDPMPIVRITIYNLHGESVRHLLNQRHKDGCYRIPWNAKDNNGFVLPSGIYFIEMSAGNWIQRIKTLLTR
jgi:aminopeptidase N